MNLNRPSTIDKRPPVPPPLAKGGIQGGFTLVEMLVVIAIIALLLAALLPAFSAVKNQAKYTEANAQFKAIDTGLNMFRSEASLGGGLPPSASDHEDPKDRQLIADPKADSPTPEVLISGSHLLVHALIGADGLGTPGFRDVSKPADGRWHNDTHRSETKGKEGLYSIDRATAKEKFPRYPQSGGGYVDEKMRDNARSLQDMQDKGSVVNLDQADSRIAKNERMFLDAWGHPILYYRASPSGLRMIGTQGNPGVYWQEDNGILTGSDRGLVNHDGLDFGQGKENNHYHSIAVAEQVEPTEPDFVTKVQTDETYEDTFVRFILDPTVKARPTPANKDSYLLISAGPDARYGTEDDVTNWTRKTE